MKKKKKKRSLSKAMFGEHLDIRHRLLNLVLLSTLCGGIMLITVHLLFRSGAAIVYPLSLLIVAVLIAMFVSVFRKQPQMAAIILVMVVNVGVFLCCILRRAVLPPVFRYGRCSD